MRVDRLVRASEALPAEATSFIGRRREMSEVRVMLGRSRLVTLVGPPGVGKTRLAVRIAEDARQAFPDGAWFADLAPVRSPALLVQTVAAALGLIDRSLRPQLDFLGESLADRCLLLVLDNCEHLLEPCAALANALLEAAPELRLLATSRQVLGAPGESVFAVLPLSLPAAETGSETCADLAKADATRLLIERVRPSLPDFARSRSDCCAVATLCRRLDGIPLAIELVAPTLRSMSPQQTVDWIDDRFPELTADRRAVPRHQSLRAAIDWSFDLCTPQERTLWARASVFAGAFELDAAEQICAADPMPKEHVLDLVTALITKSILMRVGDGVSARYRMLEVIRHYGADLLAESGEHDSVCARHRDYYAAMAAQAARAWFGPDQQRWYERLRANHANLRAVLDRCLDEPGRERTVFEVVGHGWNYWAATGAIGEGRHWLESALAKDRTPTAERLEALRGAAELAVLQGDGDAASPLAHEALAAAELLGGDALTVAHATGILGTVKLFNGDPAGALPLLGRALERGRTIDAPPGLIMLCLYALGWAECLLGDTDRALELGEEALRICQAHRADWYRFLPLWLLGFARYRRGDLPEAMMLTQESLRAEQSVNDMYTSARSLELLAWVATAQGRHRHAARVLGSADTLWRKVGVPILTMGSLQEFHDPCAARLRQALGDRAFRAAFEQGAALSADVAIAAALRDSDGDAAQPEPDTAASVLTPREQQVAELIAQGGTNKDIAATLMIGQRTVEGHVEHIKDKLGLGARAQIAAWIAEHGRGAKRDHPADQGPTGGQP